MYTYCTNQQRIQYTVVKQVTKEAKCLEQKPQWFILQQHR